MIHELGHILAGIYYKWNIDKIILLPFGAITIFKEHLNKPLKEEFIITIMGPIFQILYGLSLNNPIYLSYHYALLTFNLLPIVPLDGSKLWNILSNKITTFSKSYKNTIYISTITIIFLIIYFITKRTKPLYYCILIFLIYRIFKEYTSYHEVFSKFLLERKLYHLTFRKNKIIQGKQVTKMKKDHKHLFCINGIYQTEKYILQKMFDTQRKK